jgi:hypothetical protein
LPQGKTHLAFEEFFKKTRILVKLDVGENVCRANNPDTGGEDLGDASQITRGHRHASSWVPCPMKTEQSPTL